MVCWGFWRLLKLNSSELWDLGRWFGWFLFECSLYSKVCDRSSSEFWRLEFIKLHQCVILEVFWRLLGLISVNFKISIGSLDDFASNILCIWRLKFLKFLEASGLDSNRASILLNLLWCCLWHGCLGVLQDFSQDVLVYRNALGRLLFIGV